MPTSELTGAAGNQLGEVAGCHRVRRRTTRYAFIDMLIKIFQLIHDSSPESLIFL